MAEATQRREISHVHYGYPHLTMSAWINLDLSKCKEVCTRHTRGCHALQHNTQAGGTYGLSGKHCSIAGKFRFPPTVQDSADDKYAFGYWLDVTSSVSPAPGENIRQAENGQFFLAFHVANGPNIHWTALTVLDRPIQDNTWHYVTGSFVSGRRGNTPMMTACVDHVCSTRTLEFHSNDILGYTLRTNFYLGEAGGPDNSIDIIAPIVGKVDELLVAPYYENEAAILKRYTEKYMTASPSAIVTIDHKEMYNHALAVTLQASISGTELPNEVWNWGFLAPRFAPTEAMTTTGLNKRSLSFKANVLQPNTVYRVRVCAQVADVCSGSFNFAVVSAPTVFMTRAICTADCGPNGVHTAFVSVFDVVAFAAAARIPQEGVVSGKLEYFFFAVDPLTLDRIPLSGGFRPAASLADVKLPAGDPLTNELTIGVDVRQPETGFVGTGTATLFVQASGGTPAGAAEALTLASENFASADAIVAAAAGVASIPAAGAGRHAGVLQLGTAHTTLKTYADALLENVKLQKPSRAPHLNVLRTHLQSLVVDWRAKVNYTVEYVDQTKVVLRVSTEALLSIVSQQLTEDQLGQELEQSTVHCVDQLTYVVRAVLSVDKETEPEKQIHGLLYNLDQVRESYLKFVAMHRAAFTSVYTVSGTSAQYKGLTELDGPDANYPQLTAMGVPTTYNGAMVRKAAVNPGFSMKHELVTPGAGKVVLTAGPDLLLRGTSDIALTVALTPSPFHTRAKTSSSVHASDAALVSLYETPGFTNLQEVSNAFESTGTNVRISFLCPSCKAKPDNGTFYCAYLKKGDVATREVRWEQTQVSSEITDGAATCVGAYLGAYYAVFYDSGVIDTTPSPLGPPTQSKVLLLHVSIVFADFDPAVFVEKMAKLLGLSRGMIDVLKWCPSVNGQVQWDKCVSTGATDRMADSLAVSVTIDSGTAVFWRIGLSAEMDLIMEKLRAMTENCLPTSPMGIAGLCPIPGTRLEERDTAEPPAVAKVDSGDSNEWTVIGVVLAVCAVLLLALVAGLCWCNSKGKLCFSGYYGEEASPSEPISDHGSSNPPTPTPATAPGASPREMKSVEPCATQV